MQAKFTHAPVGLDPSANRLSDESSTSRVITESNPLEVATSSRSFPAWSLPAPNNGLSHGFASSERYLSDFPALQDAAHSFPNLNRALSHVSRPATAESTLELEPLSLTHNYRISPHDDEAICEPSFVTNSSGTGANAGMTASRHSRSRPQRVRRYHHVSHNPRTTVG